MKIKNNQKGVTLIELLVASVIALICTGAALELYVNQQKNWLAQENITDMQQNGRAAMDEMVFHARQAGYQLPPGLEAIYLANTNPDTVTFVYMKDPICRCALTHTMSDESSDLRLPTDTIDCFQPNTWAYIYDAAADFGEYFFVTDLQAGTGNMQHGLASLSRVYPAGSQVSAIDMATFYIDNSTDSLHPQLMFQRFDQQNVYADNIENLEMSFTTSYGTIVDSIITASVIRQVNIQMVARTDRIDVARGVDYIRDTLFTSVYLRNMDF